MNLEQIDTSTTAGKAEVMRLAAEGRRVAARRKIRLADEWWEPGEANWDWQNIDFAIISEPVGPDDVSKYQRVLQWVSHNMVHRNREYAMSVLKRGGDGDWGDLMAFVTEQMAKDEANDRADLAGEGK